MAEEDIREKVIIRTSVTAIGVNLGLAGLKAVIGAAANSIAITLDAVNNLSDALSSVITILGTKLGAKKPDKEHPMGYGRIEYFSELIVSTLVLYAGVSSVVESVKKILHPEAASYSTLSLVILAIGVAVKIVLGRYVKKKGIETNSGSLQASGADALSDAVLSSSVLGAAILYAVMHISLEAWLGVVIGAMIVKSGVELLKDTLNAILGERPAPELSKKVKKIVADQPGVRGVYDLVLTNYGPQRYIGSVHVELPDTMSVKDVDILDRKIQKAVYQETGVLMTGIGVYSYNTQDDAAATAEQKVRRIAEQTGGVLGIHGFYMDEAKKQLRFDATISFDVDHQQTMDKLQNSIEAAFPDYTVSITGDIDTAD